MKQQKRKPEQAVVHRRAMQPEVLKKATNPIHKPKKLGQDGCGY